MARHNITIAITSGTPTRISDLATAATVGEVLDPIYVTNFFVQMLHGGSGLGYVMTGIKNGVTPNYATNGMLTAELAPASATAPGGNFQQNQSAFGSPLAGTVDITRAWIDGSHTGDTVVVSYDTAS